MMKLIYLFILLLGLLVSCGGEKNKTFDCSLCKVDEICNENDQICEPKDKFDCNACKDYEVCREEEKKCILKEGYCKEDEQCESGKCDTYTHKCKEKEEPCEEWSTKCEGDKLLTCNNNKWNTVDCSLSGKICKTEDGKSFCFKEERGDIYPIRHGDIEENTAVSVTGTVTGIKLDNNDKINGFYIQENGSDYAGIFIYVKNRMDNTLVLGDNLKINGIYKEYNGLSEVIINDETQIEKDGSGNIDDFVLINISDLVSQRVEPYESMLVKVKGRFTVGDRDQYYNLSVKNENGDIIWLRDDLYKMNLTEGEVLTEIRGVLSYNYSKFKIFPRGEFDLIDNSAVCASVSCENGEICDVQNDIPVCVCDETNGYYKSGENCINPCNAENICNIENRHKCIALSATEFECKCDDGYVDNNGVCEEAQYCDEATYGDAFGLTGDALKAQLKIIMNRGYHNYGYDSGRLAMFSHIDNDNGVIRCVYTGEYANHPYSEDPSTQTKPDNDFFNWEHTWPHSLLGTNASSDLHHLFPTRSYVNSRRSNYPFGNVTGGDRFCDDGIDGPGTCSDDEYDYVSKLKNQIFEPADQHKGNVARAMLYMWIKYDNPGGFMDRANQFQTFKEWNRIDPVDDRERLRNSLVEYYQGNRNPFIDCPQFVDALYQ